MGFAERVKALSPHWAKEAARPVFRGYGRASVARRTHPDFLIIGTKRGGTTSLYRNLARHPAVLPMWPGVENAKKTHYFDQNWHRGDRWYRSHFPSEGQRRRVERHAGVRPVTGEAAPYYMFHPLVLERVLETIPQVRVIVLLRDPVARVWSHYHERVNAGTEPLAFSEALEAEAQRLHGEEERIRTQPRYYSERHDFSSYLARGRYLEQLEPWLDAFEASGQMHVIKSEELYTHPGETLAATHEFLGLPPVPPEAAPRYNHLPADDMDAEMRAWLVDYYRPHVHAVETRLGRSFGWRDMSLSDADISTS